MKQEELKIQIGKAEYNEEYGFIYSKEIGESKPFAFVYNNRLDQHEIGRFIVEAINDKLASTPKVEDSIGKKLAEWSRKYPRERIYGFNRQPDMDGELIKLEEEAKLLYPLSDLTSEKEEGR